MKFPRLIILILLSLSIPLLGLVIWMLLNTIHFSSDFKILAIIGIVLVICIFLLSWFFLNKKAKIVGGIFGGILGIFLIIFGFYINNSRFGVVQDIFADYGDVFEKIFPLSENILDYSLKYGNFDEKNMFQEKWELPELESLQKNFYNFFSTNYSSVYRYAGENSEKFPTIALLGEIRKDLWWKDGYKKNHIQIAEKVAQIQKLQNSNENEKNEILSNDYWNEYENLIDFINGLSDDEKQYFYQKYNSRISWIIWNHIVLTLSFWEKKLFHESVNILAEMLYEQKMENYVFEYGTPTKVLAQYLVIDSQVLQILFLARDFGIPQENFENILQILKENNREKEFENIYKMEFAWDMKNIDQVEKDGKIVSLLYEWEISPKYWNKRELIEFLEHFYTEKIKRITEKNEPKTIFSDIQDFEGYIYKIYEKYHADKNDWKVLFRKVEKNHFSRLYGIITVEAAINGLFERIEETNELKEKIFNWEK